MSSTDESENFLDHLSERVNVNGWRVISIPLAHQSLKLKS